MEPRRVVIGATFACDASLETPLQLLLRHAIDGLNIHLEWLPYGTAQSSDAWRSRQFRSNLLILLLRIRDLEAEHPELGATDLTALDRVSQFVAQVTQYSQELTNPPLVLMVCPSWSNNATEVDMYRRKEAFLVSQLKEIIKTRVVHVNHAQLVAFGFSHAHEYCDLVAEKREHLPFTPRMMDTLALFIVRQITRLVRISKKVVVLDCDNTLWGGAVAELGAEKIEIRPEHMALQQFMVQLQQRGMVLCLCSKNLERDVLQVFETRRDDMVLRLEQHIVSHRINWEPKSENLRELAKELSLGLESFIFVDDNPIECHEVASNLPVVHVVQVPAWTTSLSSHQGAWFALNEWIFDEPITFQIANTAEDATRSQMYRENIQRQRLARTSGALAHSSAFLSSLGIKITFEELTSVASASFDRVLQLHQRTNQFNIATEFSRRVDRSFLRKYIQQPAHRVICASVTDRFGHYGLVGVALFRSCHDKNGIETKGELVVDSFLLSCRALNRGIEHAIVKRIADQAVIFGHETILMAWERTERNDPVLQFLRSIKNATITKCPTASSLATTACWQIRVDDALSISFLRENENDQLGIEPLDESKMTQWQRASSCLVQWCQWSLVFVCHLARCLLDRLRIPRFLMALCGKMFILSGKPVRAAEHRCIGLLKYPVHLSIQSLEDFLNRHRSSDSNQATQLDSLEQTEHELCKFRRKARHQAKVALLDHVADGNTRTVWSANRLTHVANHDKMTNCATTSCSAVIQINGGCRFSRCRNCCYRIQRLMHRHRHHSHSQARDQAAQTLVQDFHLSHIPPTTLCGAHRNRRRVAD